MAELLLLLICLLISTMNTVARAAANGQVGQLELVSLNSEPVNPSAIQNTSNDRVKQMYGKDILPEASQKPTLQGCDGQATWCIAKPSTGDERLNANIEFCCKDSGIDCRIIQPGGRCYNPNNNYSHASVVMNLYYRANNKQLRNCDFIQSGLIISQDPSVGECIYGA